MDLIEINDLKSSGFKKGIIAWKDPCLMIGVSLKKYESKLYNFFTIGWYRKDPDKSGIYNLVFKVDRLEFPEGQNIFLNVPEGNVMNITELYTKEEAIKELKNEDCDK